MSCSDALRHDVLLLCGVLVVNVVDNDDVFGENDRDKFVRRDSRAANRIRLRIANLASLPCSLFAMA